MENHGQPEVRTSFFQPLRVIHGALLVGCLAMLAVVRFLLLDGAEIDSAEITDPLIRFTPVVVLIIGVLAGSLLFQQQIKAAVSMDKLIDKLNAYRAACIVRWAALEAPALLSTIWFLIYADKFFMAIALVSMALLAFARPNPAKAAQQLQLNEEETNEITRVGY